MDEVFCPKCNEKVKYKMTTEKISTFKGIEVNVTQNVPVCLKCGEQIFIPETEEKNFNVLYDKYRELANYIYPNDIIEFREKYCISQRELGNILDWGKMTINRYENGSLPSRAHNDILKTCINNTEFFLEKTKEAFGSGRIKEKTLKKVNGHILEGLDSAERTLTVINLKDIPSIDNGFVGFELEKVENLISYIASNVDNFTRTSINKYFWYIDLLYFKLFVLSITGLKYVKAQYGPVIEKRGYEEILSIPTDLFYTEICDINGYECEKIYSNNNYDLSFFIKDEIEVINKVINVLKHKSVTQISQLSHKEKGWIDTNFNEYISFEYAKDLKLL